MNASDKLLTWGSFQRTPPGRYQEAFMSQVAIGKEHLSMYLNAFSKAGSVVGHASKELSQMHEEHMNATVPYEYSATTIYEIASMLDMVRNKLEDHENMLFSFLNSNHHETKEA